MKNRYFILMILSFYFFAFGIETSAAELRFSVETEIPENQIDKTKTYFDLMMKPDQEQILKVRAANSTDENLVIDVSVKSATTNSNGVIEYGESLTALDKSAPADLSEIIQLKDGGESVELPAKSEKVVELRVKMPKEEFSGQLAGGITFSEKVDETKDKQKENTNGLAIENRYAYTVAVLLRENETVVQPELSLEKVEPTQRNARSVISATLLNHEAAYLQSMKVTANVKNKKTNNVILEKEQEDMQMAPNSIFNFPIPYEENEMEAGTYVLAMTVEGSGKKWQFTKEFTISKEEAKTFNEKDVTVTKTESKLIYLLIGLLILLLIICLFIILRLKKQKNK
ncbi:TPA: DUF916 and DUF3324 domain-containing protein [Enterococcus faecalis]|nr:DUF916 and DUF3324 domain-containing protein [Enterococcus faecalis]